MRWLIVVGCVLVVPGVGFAQGLGGAAQKEAQRRKANAEAGVKARSIDDETLQNGSGAGKGTFSTTGVATTNDNRQRAASRPGAAGRPSASESSDDSTSGLSGMDQLREKIAKWREQYRPVKAAVDSLEREVADLEERAAKIAGIATDRTTPRDPNIRTGAERTTERLPLAREELVRTRQRLAEIEEDARREGVSSSQLERR